MYVVYSVLSCGSKLRKPHFVKQLELDMEEDITAVVNMTGFIILILDELNYQPSPARR